MSRGGEMGDHSEPVAGEKEEGMLHPLLLSDEGEDWRISACLNMKGSIFVGKLKVYPISGFC